MPVAKVSTYLGLRSPNMQCLMRVFQIRTPYFSFISLSLDPRLPHLRHSRRQAQVGAAVGTFRLLADRGRVQQVPQTGKRTSLDRHFWIGSRCCTIRSTGARCSGDFCSSSGSGCSHCDGRWGGTFSAVSGTRPRICWAMRWTGPLSFMETCW